MKMRRFCIADNENGNGCDVIDVLNDVVIANFSHERRAVKFADEKMREAEKNGDIRFVGFLHNSKGEIIKRYAAD